MSQCFNPVCNHINPSNTKFCQRCGSQLLVNDRYRAQSVIGQGGFGLFFSGFMAMNHSKGVLKALEFALVAHQDAR